MLQVDFSIIKNRLAEILKRDLPGEKAHRLMLPPGRDLYPPSVKSNILLSSVLILVFPVDGVLSTCLIRRSVTMKNHGGQIAFPGGRYEAMDKELVRTALRESNEEIGTVNDQIEIIGALSPIYVQVSNFTIHPFIGWCESYPHFEIDRREVDELYLIPVEKLLSDAAYQSREVITPRGTFDAPGYYIDPLFIWGATAMIIAEFNAIFRSVIECP